MFELPYMKTRMYNCLLDLKKNPNKKVFIDPDADPDGFIACKIVKETLDLIGHRRYFINRLQSKRHGIDDTAIQKAIQYSADYLIVVDSSSNIPLDIIEYITSHEIELIIMDHHEVVKFHEEIPGYSLITTKKMKEYNWVSAGFLTYMVCGNALKELGYGVPLNLFIWGWITLYSDSTPISNQEGEGIRDKILSIRLTAPEEVKVFMDQYSSLTRGFIGFQYVNKLNACVRTNNFDIIHDYLYEGKLSNVNEILRIYKRSRELTKELADLANIQIINENFFIADITSAYKELGTNYSTAVNYTGVVCQQLCTEWNKSGMVYISNASGKCKGSVRDIQSRDLLSLVSNTVMECGGHKPAFGTHFLITELPMIRSSLTEMTKDLVSNLDTWETEGVPTSKEIEAMALHNEIAGFNGVKFKTFSIKVSSTDYQIKKRGKKIDVTGHGLVISVFESFLMYGSRLSVKPVLNKNIDLIGGVIE